MSALTSMWPTSSASGSHAHVVKMVTIGHVVRFVDLIERRNGVNQKATIA
jgi:hypothetical protein